MFLYLNDSYFFLLFFVILIKTKNKRRLMSFLRFGHKCMVFKEAAVGRYSVERLFWKCSENSQGNVGDGDLVY